MADYTYRIYSGAPNVAPNFTSIGLAVADFKTVNRMGAGVGVVAAASTLFLLVDGFLTSGGDNITGIDVSASGAKIIVGSWGNRWNASAANRLGYSATYDGVNFGGSANLNVINQAGVTIQDLVLAGSIGDGSGDGVANLQGTSASLARITRCVVRASKADGSSIGVRLDYGAIDNSLVLLTGYTLLRNAFLNVGHVTANTIDQCAVISLTGGAVRLLYSSGDPLPVIRNTYFGGVTSWTNSGTWTSASVGNATDQASGPPGASGTLTSIALDTTNFGNVTAGSEDLRVKSGSVLNTTGAARLAGVTTDVFGTARTDPTTIGAHQYAVAAVNMTGSVTIGGAQPVGNMVNANPMTGALPVGGALPAGSMAGGTTMGGSLTVGGALPAGSMQQVPASVTTPPVALRAGGSRPTGYTGLAAAVLTNDAAMTRIAGATSIDQNPDGTITVPNVPLAAGTSVIVLVRRADGKLGHRICTVQ